MSSEEYICYLCNSNWSKDEYTDECELCGGGAMKRDCGICDGECGRKWTRMLLDSLDSGEAHWIMDCGLPQQERYERMRKKMQEMSEEK